MRVRLVFIEEDTEAVIFDLSNVLLGYDCRPSGTMRGRARYWQTPFSAASTGREETGAASHPGSGSSSL